MKKFAKLFLALTLVAVPVAFTSCDDSDYYDGYTHDNLVAEAVYNYRNMIGTNSYWDAYNFFWHNYPEAYNDEFNAFMNAVLNSGSTPYWRQYYDENYRWNNYYDNRPTSADNQLVAEARTLVGEWEGDMVYEYQDDSNGNERVRDQFTANMKFFQYNSDSNELKGNGVEVDTKANGATQTLDFTWYIADDGDIYIKYTRSGSVFVFDASSSTQGFHLGLESGRNYDTFFGTALGKNTEDVLTIDLKRKGTSSFTRANATVSSSKSYGKGTRSVLATFKKDARKR